MGGTGVGGMHFCYFDGCSYELVRFKPELHLKSFNLILNGHIKWVIFGYHDGTYIPCNTNVKEIVSFTALPFTLPFFCQFNEIVDGMRWETFLAHLTRKDIVYVTILFLIQYIHTPETDKISSDPGWSTESPPDQSNSIQIFTGLAKIDTKTQLDLSHLERNTLDRGEKFTLDSAGDNFSSRVDHFRAFCSGYFSGSIWDWHRDVDILQSGYSKL